MITKIDDFIKRVESTAEEDLFTPRTFYHLSSSMFHEMCELLKEQEAITATFEKDGHHLRCSNCGEYFCSKDCDGNVFPQNYCPNCGAKMELLKE